MKSRFPILLNVESLSVTAVFLALVAGSTVLSGKGRTESHAAESNAVPRSEFSIPTNKHQGRDPFFPDCECGTKAVTIVDPNLKVPAISLVYNGRSGTAEKPLAMINGKTFALGEGPQDVPTQSGIAKVPVRLVEIKEKSVVVEVGGKQQELFLRGN